MAFREGAVIEIREVLRCWLGGHSVGTGTPAVPHADPYERADRNIEQLVTGQVGVLFFLATLRIAADACR